MATLLVARAVGLCGSQGDWPHYLGPNFDGRPTVKSFSATAARRLWSASVTTGCCSVTIANGLLYTMGNDGKKADRGTARDIIYCLNADTGREVWRFAYPCRLEPRQYPGGPNATPTVDAGRVYTLSKLGHLFCLDARTGEKVWEADARRFNPKRNWWGYAGSPTVVGDVVCYNIGNKGLGLGKHTGEVVWASEQPEVGYATVLPLPQALLGRPAIVVLTSRDLHVLDPATGRPVATVERTWGGWSNCNGVTPYLHGQHLYVLHGSQGMARLSLHGTVFRQDWLSEAARYGEYHWYTFTTHARYKDHAYYLARSNDPKEMGLACVDLRTGERKWRDRRFRFGNVLLAGDTLIMLDDRGHLIWGALGDASFQEAYRARILDGLCWSCPVLLGDRLYARDAQGTVVCLKLE